MFESFKTFISEFVDGEKHPSQFADDDYRLAAAALLVHAATIDGDMSQSEGDKLRALLQKNFTLDDAATAELIEKATAVERESVDLYHFTHQLNRSLNEAGRARIVEMMWEIVYADGRRDELEDNLLWRAADLLGVSPQERIALRRRIGGEDIAVDDKDTEGAGTGDAGAKEEDRSGA
jgi:uncharacterized tellurite resistance protein B-like protein